MKQLFFLLAIILFLPIPSSYASSHINFHVDAPNPTLTILNPNGSERLLGGSTYTIRWEDSGSESCGGNYLLDYSIDDGNSWIAVDSNPVSNTCSYDWLVPSTFSNQSLFRITDANDPNISDTSDDSFLIYLCMSDVLGDWNSDCYADFGDFSIIAAGWNVHGGTDMNDLAGFVQYWLDCANPYDPYCCNFGQAMPRHPADGSVIRGSVYAGHIYTWLDFFPGATAVDFRGYAGENYDDVLNRTQDANLGPPPYAGYDRYYIGLHLVQPFTQSLVQGTKYYWAVDSYDAKGNVFPSDIWEFTIHDVKATLPNPPNEATFVETDVLLSWYPGVWPPLDWSPTTWPLEHYVYLGTSWEDVNNVHYRYPYPPEYLGYTFEPNMAVTGLELNTTYYWRVDEALYLPPPWGSFVHYCKGDVWCFTTKPGPAEPYFPADGAVIPGSEYAGHVYTWLDFLPGPTAVDFRGYASENYDDVLNRVQDANLGPPPYPAELPYRYYIGIQLVQPFTRSLVRGKKYYWAVDSYDAKGNVFPSDIWEFTIQDLKATLPNPPNEAAFVETDVLLSWLPGCSPPPDCPPSTFLEHDVYLGTDFNDVNNAIYRYPYPPEYLGYTTEPNYLVVGLEPGTHYFWRIDEVWGRNPLWTYDIYKGDVWKFTTAPSALNNDGSISSKDYPIPSICRQKTGPILPADFHKDDVVDYQD